MVEESSFEARDRALSFIRSPQPPLYSDIAGGPLHLWVIQPTMPENIWGKTTIMKDNTNRKFIL